MHVRVCTCVCACVRACVFVCDCMHIRMCIGLDQHLLLKK